MIGEHYTRTEIEQMSPLIAVGPPIPDVPLDGRWHRWNGRRLVTALLGGGYCVQNVSRWRWLLRYGGDAPELTNRAS